MRVVVHAVGRMKAGPERELAARFLDRFGKAGSGLGLSFGGVVELAESRLSSAVERRREETGRLLDTARGGMLVLLDERGKSIGSHEFAAKIAAARDSGVGQLVFAIGGPDGHDDSARAAASAVLAFGAQTWPHQFVRIMLAEQLYRAATILSGHPYHRA